MIKTPNFVRFVSFVVNIFFLTCLRLRRARIDQGVVFGPITLLSQRVDSLSTKPLVSSALSKLLS